MFKLKNESMKTICCAIMIMLFNTDIYSQQKVLFVDDSGDQFLNSQYLASTLDSLGYEYYYYDANGLGQSPIAEEMLDFDVVIWHTSTWGAGLHLWNTDNTINPEVVAYLDNPLSKFWLIGNDFMYDKYETPADTFVSGDFPYDYLGIAQYTAQSYIDDNNTGLPRAIPAGSSPVNVQTLTWSVGNLWYADGYELAENASPVYLMNGEDYILDLKITGMTNITSASSHVLTYGFDLSLAENFNMMKQNVETVLNWFDGLAGIKNPGIFRAEVSLSPNPVSDELTISVNSKQDLVIRIDLWNLSGRFIADLGDPAHVNGSYSSTFALPDELAKGIYLCRVSSGEGSQSFKLVKI